MRSRIAKRGKLPAETRNYVVTITGRAADAWRGVTFDDVAFAVPAAVPCNDVETFAAATRSEQEQALALLTPQTRPTVSATRSARRRHRTSTRVAALKLRDRAHRKG